MTITNAVVKNILIIIDQKTVRETYKAIFNTFINNFKKVYTVIISYPSWHRTMSVQIINIMYLYFNVIGVYF